MRTHTVRSKKPPFDTGARPLDAPRAHWARTSVQITAVCLLVLLASAKRAEAQTTGWTHRSGTIERLVFSLEGQTVEVEDVVDTGLLGSTHAVALAPDRRLFVAMAGPSLFAVDLDSGDSDLIGDLPVDDFFGDLSVDASGQLWFTADGLLFQLDPDTAAATPVLLADEYIVAAAALGDELFGLVRGPDEGSSQNYELVRIDPSDGSVQLISTLGPFSSGCFAQLPTSMDFDDAGGLWVSVGVFIGCILPPPPDTYFLYLRDPLGGSPAEELLPASPSFLPAIATEGSPALTALEEIPVTGRFGQLALVLLIAFGGAWILIARTP